MRTTHYLLIFSPFVVAACAPTWGGSSGRFSAPNATCTVIAPGGTAARSFIKTAYVRDGVYGPRYAETPVGIRECVIPAGAPVLVHRNGFYMNTKEVSHIGGSCSGDVEVGTIGQCSGGDSISEQLFPFTKPLPVYRVP